MLAMAEKETLENLLDQLGGRPVGAPVAPRAPIEQPAAGNREVEGSGMWADYQREMAASKGAQKPEEPESGTSAVSKQAPSSPPEALSLEEERARIRRESATEERAVEAEPHHCDTQVAESVRVESRVRCKTSSRDTVEGVANENHSGANTTAKLEEEEEEPSVFWCGMDAVASDLLEHGSGSSEMSKWEFKWAMDADELHGPYDSEEIIAWADDGYFEEGLWIRKFNEKKPTAGQFMPWSEQQGGAGLGGEGREAHALV